MGEPRLAAMIADVPGEPTADGPKLGFENLVDQLVRTAESIRQAQGRLRGLLRAIETVTGDLSLEHVLHNIVEATRELAGAEYCALGVIGRDGGLDQFIYSGLTREQAAKIGDLPQGKGLLGALITTPEPIRLRRMRNDPRSSGFPPNHPAMESFLGVPVRSRGEVFGNLYLCNASRGEFTAEDEELVLALAMAAGTAIGNARRYTVAQVQQRWLEASVEISSQLLSLEGEDPLRTVARRAIEIADGDLVSISLLSPEDDELVVEIALGARASEIVAQRVPVEGTMAGTVVRTGAPLLLTDAAAEEHSVIPAQLNAGPAMLLPLGSAGRTRGVLHVLRTRGRATFSQADMTMAAGFAAHASLAVELAEARSADQRLRLLEDRERIARDLHDHVIQELFGIGMGLNAAAVAAGEGPLADRLNGTVADLDRTIRRIRTSIFQLRGNLGTTADGFSGQILSVAADLSSALGFAPHVAFAGLVEIRVNDDIAQDAVACVRELLSNVAKHARATTASVDVELVGEELTIMVSDDGGGPPAEPHRRSGIANLLARAERRHGTFELRRGPAGGTVATWKIRVR